MLNMLSLCAGIGGADLAAEATHHIRTTAFAEIEPFCCRVLKQHWPQVPNLGDIHGITPTTLRAAGVAPESIDLVCAAIPCQGNSVAGKRRGRADERNLWPATAQILRTLHPRWFVLENVSGLLSSSTDAGQRDSGVFGDILRDLAQMGYAAGWIVYGAAEVGAPHQRDRVFIVAHSRHDEQQRWHDTEARGIKERNETRSITTSCSTTLADTTSDAWECQQSQRQNLRDKSAINGSQGAFDERLLADTADTGLPFRGCTGLATSGAQTSAGVESESERCSVMADSDSRQRREWQGLSGGWDTVSQSKWRHDTGGCSGLVADTSASRWRAGERPVQTRQSDAKGGRESVVNPSGTGREECHTPAEPGSAGYPARRPGTDGQLGQIVGGLGDSLNGLPAGVAGHTGRADSTEAQIEVQHQDAYANWQGWPSGPKQPQHAWEPTRTTQTSEKDRAAKLRALGNAIVPEQIYPVFAAIVDVEMAERERRA